MLLFFFALKINEIISLIKIMSLLNKTTNKVCQHFPDLEKQTIKTEKEKVSPAQSVGKRKAVLGPKGTR